MTNTITSTPYVRKEYEDHVKNIENQLDRHIELQSQRCIYENKLSITYESSSQW